MLGDALNREWRSEYKLTVRADDGEQFTETVVSVKVVDTNDNSPTFSEAAYSFDIPEDTGRGAFVGAVVASDLDEGINAQVSYTVLSDWGNDVFSLNPQSGVFTLTSRLDYEQVQHYIFVVQAQDTGRPSLSSTVTVYFTVLDLNDNAPLFNPMSYSDELYENITVGSSVLTVSATDQDSGKIFFFSFFLFFLLLITKSPNKRRQWQIGVQHHRREGQGTIRHHTKRDHHDGQIAARPSRVQWKDSLDRESRVN